MKYVQIFNQRNNNMFLLRESQVPIPAGLFMWHWQTGQGFIAVNSI